jgi:hypothetical protein
VLSLNVPRCGSCMQPNLPPFRGSYTKLSRILKRAPVAPCQSFICCDAKVNFAPYSFAAPTPGLWKEPRALLEPRFAPWGNYPCQDPNNRKFDKKSTFFNEPVPSGVAMSDLSNGIKKPSSKSRETIS